MKKAQINGKLSWRAEIQNSAKIRLNSTISSSMQTKKKKEQADNKENTLILQLQNKVNDREEQSKN